MCFICVSIVMASAIRTMEMMFWMTMKIFEKTVRRLASMAPFMISDGEYLMTAEAGISPAASDRTSMSTMHPANVDGTKMSPVLNSAVWDIDDGSHMSQFTDGTAAAAISSPAMKQKDVNIRASAIYLLRISPVLEPRSLRVAISLALFTESATERLM